MFTGSGIITIKNIAIPCIHLILTSSQRDLHNLFSNLRVIKLLDQHVRNTFLQFSTRLSGSFESLTYREIPLRNRYFRLGSLIYFRVTTGNCRTESLPWQRARTDWKRERPRGKQSAFSAPRHTVETAPKKNLLAERSRDYTVLIRRFETTHYHPIAATRWN